MAEDFFGALGKKISKVTQSAVDKTSSLVETTKINSQITAEQKEIDKLFQKIGQVILRKADAGEIQPGEEENALICEIRGHEERILEFRKNLAAAKGMKLCPGCGELIAIDVAFCPKCGAPTPVVKAEEPVEEAVEACPDEEAVKASAEAAEEASAEGVEEASAEAAEKTSAEAAEEVPDAPYVVLEEASEEVQDAAYEVLEQGSEAAGESSEACSDAAETEPCSEPAEACGDAAEAEPCSEPAEACSDTAEAGPCSEPAEACSDTAEAESCGDDKESGEE